MGPGLGYAGYSVLEMGVGRIAHMVRIVEGDAGAAGGGGDVDVVRLPHSFVGG